jgi:hypothetical protein
MSVGLGEFVPSKERSDILRTIVKGKNFIFHGFAIWKYLYTLFFIKKICQMKN